jgi:2-polyprenyl-6-methoxyphenol hydroxylase-like FAD-dependent oxidoreductase
MSRNIAVGASRHAVVIGGGIAGIVTARVLADHFERVTLLEREVLTPDTEVRAGVAQGRHAHLLLSAGHHVIERLFPKLGPALEAAGAPLGDHGEDAIAVYPQGRLPRYKANLPMRFVSRGLRERLMRNELLENPRFTLRDGVSVQGLVGEGYGVAGVRLRRAGGAQEEMRADLVVATCGRDAPVVDWLVALGYSAPEETVVDAGLSYSSRWFRLPHAQVGYLAAGELPVAPDQPRGGIALAAEHDAWVVTLIGTAQTPTPHDEAGFLEWAHALTRCPQVEELIRRAEPISPIYGFAKAKNRLRHFDRMKRFPERFVVLGDAAASLNPIYGQGMTVAVLGAEELGKCLAEQRERLGGSSLTGLSRRFQRRLARLQVPAWQMATGEDFRWPGTVGKRPPTQKLVHAYFDTLLQLATEDAEMARAVQWAQHMMAPPSALFRPSVVRRVLERAARPALGKLVAGMGMRMEMA